MDKWKTIEPNVWRPKEKGDCIIGALVNKQPKDETTGLSARYQIENQEGMFLIWGSAVLDDRMQYAKIGDKIRITFDGKTKNKRNQDVNLFIVDVATGSQEDGKAEVISELHESNSQRTENKKKQTIKSAMPKTPSNKNSALLPALVSDFLRV